MATAEQLAVIPERGSYPRELLDRARYFPRFRGAATDNGGRDMRYRIAAVLESKLIDPDSGTEIATASYSKSQVKAKTHAFIIMLIG